MREIDLAYIAGLVDGEGCIRIKKSTYGIRIRKDCQNPTYSEMIQIRMVNEPAIKFIQSRFGGNYYLEKRPYGNKPLYCYQITCKLASNMIKQLLPYLKVKKEVAKIVLKLRKSKENKDSFLRGCPTKQPMKKEIVDFRESLYLETKKLNGSI